MAKLLKHYLMDIGSEKGTMELDVSVDNATVLVPYSGINGSLPTHPPPENTVIRQRQLAPVIKDTSACYPPKSSVYTGSAKVAGS